jgi:hypothetical protein
MADQHDERRFPLDEALKALSALRQLGGMAPEQFPVPAFVGMISDEVEALRAKGISDQQIAETIASHSSIQISADDIAEHYASPEQRHGEHP